MRCSMEDIVSPVITSGAFGRVPIKLNDSTAVDATFPELTLT